MDLKQVKIIISNEKFSSIILKMLDENIDVSITVTGNSMFPLWRDKRDTVVLTKNDTTLLKKGDIPLYRRNSGQYVMHRIIKVNKDSYNLCGDAYTQIEYDLPRDKIIAVVKAFTRKGKYYDCNNPWVRLYTVLWIRLLPFRGFFVGAYILFGKKLRTLICEKMGVCKINCASALSKDKMKRKGLWSCL
ncbi:MAG: S24/S26 family peptidase [Syntrophomonadaceae bacterium]